MRGWLKCACSALGHGTPCPYCIQLDRFQLLWQHREFKRKSPGDLSNMAKATFAAGCFWGVEDAFRHLKGVNSTTVGYTGGTMKNPSYENVCTGRTGHAEAVEIDYDPAQVTYEQLLGIFWESHDPTTLNRQGPDVGTQYRSEIFFHDVAQEQSARASKSLLEKSGVFKRPIVTVIEPAAEFFRAEDYHQQYFEKRGMKSCHLP